MARKLQYDRANKCTFTKENVMSVVMTGTRTCTNCKRAPKTLYAYWHEMDIGGVDQPPPHTLPFCGIKCYRDYYNEG